MTSSDGDDPQFPGPAGNGRRNAEARGPGPDDDDPVRLTPPADPWLAEASTSALDSISPPASGPLPPSDGPVPLADGPVPPAYVPVPPAYGSVPPASGVVPPDDPAPFARAAHPGYPTPPGGPAAGWAGGPPRRRRGRRAARWAVAVLAVCALLVAGMLGIDQFGSGDGSDAQGPDPSAAATTGRARTPAADPLGDVGVPAGRQPSAATGSQPGSSAGAAPGTSAQPGAREVIYQVTASGSRNVGSVSYTDQDGEIIRLSGIPLPWRTAFPMGVERRPRVLIAQRKRGGDAGPVTCTITVDGKLLSATTADGRYAAPQCSGFG